MNARVPKPRGRPKGARNKKRLLSGVSVERICDYHRFHPTEFLIQVAAGTETSEEWTKDDRLRAAAKLHDSIHHQRALPGGQLGEIIDGQCELVFVEESSEFEPPASATGLPLSSEVSSEVVEA